MDLEFNLLQRPFHSRKRSLPLQRVEIKFDRLHSQPKTIAKKQSY